MVPVGHALAQAGGPVRLAQAAGETWIASVPGSVCYERLMRVLPGIRPRYLVAEFASQLTLVAAGLGVVPVDPPPTRRVTVAWRAAATVRPATGAAIEALRVAWPSVETPHGGQ